MKTPISTTPNSFILRLWPEPDQGADLGYRWYVELKHVRDSQSVYLADLEHLPAKLLELVDEPKTGRGLK
jgi:hypothetical protein